MAHAETQTTTTVGLAMTAEEAGYLLNLLRNHTLQVGLNRNGGPLASIREALREAGVTEINAYSSLASRGCASMYATSEEARAALPVNLHACHLCGGTAGDIVNVTLYGKPVSYMHAYGACKTEGSLRQ